MKGWGVLFKLTLMPHGYTVAGKGSVEEGWTHGLCKEEKIYRLLQPVQGSDTPVFLGSLHLDRHYVFERAWINHFLLLSWGGQGLEFNTMTKDHITAYRQALRNIRGACIDMGMHVPYQNALWSEERGTVQIIGFRSATAVEEWQKLGKRVSSSYSLRAFWKRTVSSRPGRIGRISLVGNGLYGRMVAAFFSLLL